VNHPRTALIVGAGIGGLAAGLALRRAGWDVRIYERAAAPRELGFALALAPNAMDALRELDLADTLTASGVTPTKFEVRHTDGRVIRRLDVQPGGAGVIALRHALHGALLNAVGSEVILPGSEAIDVASGQEGVVLRLRDGRTETGEIVVGADGVGSVVRSWLHPGEPPPRESGFYGLRGVARGVASQLGELAAVGYLGDGVEAATARASADAVYWYLSLLARDVAAGPRHPRLLLDRLTPDFDPAFRAILAATEDDDMRLDEVFQRPPLLQWGAGRITLLGDAAHPVLPHTGQGAAQALEDAVALGIVLSKRDEDVEPALREYERVRSWRTRRLIAMGPRIARMTTTRNPMRKLIRTMLLRFTPESILVGALRRRRRDPHRALRTWQLGPDRAGIDREAHR